MKAVNTSDKTLMRSSARLWALFLGFLIAIGASTPTASYAYDDSGFRRGGKLEDRRVRDAEMKMKALSRQLETSRKNLIAIGKMGQSRGWAAECVGLKNVKSALVDIGKLAQAAPPATAVLPEDMGAMVAGIYGTVEIDSVDVCSGAIRAQSEGTKSVASKLADLNQKFESSYEQLEDAVDQAAIKIYLREMPKEKQKSCLDTERKIVETLTSFHEAYTKIDDEITQNLSEIMIYAKTLNQKFCDPNAAPRVPSN